MTWTTEKPTNPGWYWWRQDSEFPECVEVFDDPDNGLCIGGHTLDHFCFLMNESDHEIRWSSEPIQQPKEQP